MKNEYFTLFAEKKFKEAEEHRIANIPLKLIKFISLGDDTDSNEMKFSSLERDELWFSSAKELNDPYEFKCMYVDHERLKEHGYTEYILNKFDEVVSEQHGQFAVVSLSANSPDYLPMWAYYTNNHQGFCVQYDVTKPDRIYQVGYEPRRIPVATTIANQFHEFAKIQKGEVPDKSEMEFYGRLLLQQFFLKHESWAGEKEYRIVYPFDGGKGINVKIADVGLKTSRIIAGLNCSSEHKDRLNKISNGIGCGNISSTQISGTNYTLIQEDTHHG